MREMREFKLARVVAACEEVRGRVRLQKIVYLLRAMNYDLPFDDFMIRHYGPYSRELAAVVDFLANVKLLRETTQSTPGGHEEFSYSVPNNLRPRLEQLELRGPNEKPIDEMARELASKRREVLEVAATEVYLRVEERLQAEELQRELVTLKGHYQPDFEEAKALIESLQARRLLTV